MSSEDNLEMTKAGYAAFAAADVDAATENLDDGIEWTIPGQSAISGTYRGKEEVIGFWMTLVGRGFTTEPHDFLSGGDKVVVLTTTTVDGQAIEQADVLTFRDGRVVTFYSYGDTALSEQIWGTK